MSIRSAIYDMMNDAEADVYPVVAPQETTDPYAVYMMRKEPVRAKQGVPVWTVFLTVEIFANTLQSCVTLADLIQTYMERQSGTYGFDTVIGSMMLSEADGGYISDLDKYNITQEYQIHFD
jgi:hypothetical protein